MRSTSTSRTDVYEAITNQIIAAIDAGTGEVQLPWHRKGSAIYRPVNIASGKAYRGVNTVALWAAADANQFAHGVWGTYRQWQERGDYLRVKVLELLLVKGMANRDVAALLKISEQQVANYRFAAVKKLTEKIRDAGLPTDVFPELHNNPS